MSDQTIFNGNTPAGTPPANTPQNDDPNANLLGMILNEQGQQKYQNVTEALKGAAHAQAYIAELKRQLQEAESKAAANIASKEKQDELERTVQELLNRQSQTPTSGPDLDPTKLADLIEQTLTKRQMADLAKANQAAVVAELTKAFGEQAEEKYKAAAQELGISTADLDVMAAKSPKAVLKALGVEAKPVSHSNVAPPPTAVNTAGFQPHQDSFVKKNTNQIGVGATTQDLHAEAQRAKQMVDELHKNGLEVGDLSDPKQFFKYFK